MVRLHALAWIAVTASAPPAWATEVSEITQEDFLGAYYFKNALEHPEVAKIEDRTRQIYRVARDLGWKSAKLQAAVDKVDALEGDLVELAQKAIMDGFRGTRLEGQVLDVLINAQEPKHAVVYIRWRGSHSRDIIKEAATIGHVVHQKAPFISTASIAVIHPKAPGEVKDERYTMWSAKLGHSSMSRINPDRIEDYADRLYKSMFENVKAKDIPF